MVLHRVHRAGLALQYSVRGIVRGTRDGRIIFACLMDQIGMPRWIPRVVHAYVRFECESGIAATGLMQVVMLCTMCIKYASAVANIEDVKSSFYFLLILYFFHLF